MSYNTILATAPLTTQNYHLKMIGTSIGNSLIWDNGTNVGIGNTNTSYTLDVSGTGRFLTTNTTPLIIQTTGGNCGMQMLTSSTTTNWLVAAQYSTANTFEITPSTTVGGQTYSTPALKIASTGAATFSSSVTSSFGSSGANFNSNAATTGSVNAYRVSNTTGTASFGIDNSVGGDLITGGLPYATLLQSISNTALQLGTNQTARLTITSGGNVGIGTSSPSYKFHVSNNTNGFITRFTGGTSSDVNIGIFGSTAGAFGSIGTESNHPFNIFTNGTDRMTITSGGDVLVNSTSTSSGAKFNVFYSDATHNGQVIRETTGNASVTYMIFNSNGTQTGSISRVGSTAAVLYNTSSDYRLKEDLKEIKGLDKIAAIKVYDFQWIGTEERMDGVLAHELQEILPYAVSGKKDAIDEEGNIKSQGVDYSKIVPVLVKAIQEQQIQIQNLQEQINILAK